MKIKDIIINRLPGIKSCIKLENLCSGINIIYGDNGSGKSSICRLIKSSLWLNKSPNTQTDAILKVSENKNSYISKISERPIWMDDNGDIINLNLPDKEFANCFFISLTNLLEQNSLDEQNLIKKINIEATGGLDFDAIQDAAKPKKRTLQRVIDNLKELTKTKTKIELELNDLANEESELNSINKAIIDANKSRNQLKELEDAIEKNKLLDILSSKEDELSNFPKYYQCMSGEEYNSFLKINKEVDSLEEELKKIGIAKKEIEAKICSNDSLYLSDSKIKIIQTKLSKLRVLDSEYNLLEANVTSSYSKLMSLDKQLNLELDIKEYFIDLPNESLLPILEKIKEYDFLVSERASIKQNIKNIQITPCFSKLSVNDIKLNKQLSDLHKWLSIPDKQKSSFKRHLVLLCIAIALLITSSIIFDSLTIVFTGIIISLVILIIDRFIFLNSDEEQKKKLLEKEIELNLGKKNTWERGEIVNSVMDFTISLKNKDEARKIQSTIDTLNRELCDIEKRLNDIDLYLASNEIYKRLSSLSSHSYELIINSIKQYRSETIRHNDLTEQLSKLNKEVIKLSSELSQSIGENDTGKRIDIEEFSINLNNLINEFNNQKVLNEKLNRNNEIHQSLSNELNKLKLNKQEILSLFKLEDSAAVSSEIKNIVGLFIKFTELRNETFILKTKLGSYTKQHETSILEIKLEEAQQSALEYENLISRREKINSDIENAIKNKNLNKINTSITLAKEELEHKKRDVLLSLSKIFVVNNVVKAIEQKHKPKVLSRSEELFNQFTNNKYTLSIGNKQSIKVFDLVNEEFLTLSQISDGTKVQLLLAIKLAFIESVETESKLPIFFDETLSTTDNSRFLEIVKSIVIFCGNDRQAFYFTSDINDLEKWKLSANTDDLKCFEISKTPKKIVRDISMSNTFDNSKYEKLSPIEFAETLNIEAFSPYSNFGSVHIYHLLSDELNTLKSIVQFFKIENLGQLSNIIDDESYFTSKLDYSKYSILLVRVKSFAVFQNLWLQGRGRPIDIHELPESISGIKGDMLNRLQSIIREHGSADKVMNSLVNEKGFGSAKQKAVKLVFEELGYFINLNLLQDLPSIRKNTFKKVRETVDNDINSELIFESIDFIAKLFINE